jgi:hypothetical protein
LPTNRNPVLPGKPSAPEDLHGQIPHSIASGYRIASTGRKGRHSSAKRGDRISFQNASLSCDDIPNWLEYGIKKALTVSSQGFFDRLSPPGVACQFTCRCGFLGVCCFRDQIIVAKASRSISVDIELPIAIIIVIVEVASGPFGTMTTSAVDLVSLADTGKGRSNILKLIVDIQSHFTESNNQPEDSDCGDQNQFCGDDETSFVVEEMSKSGVQCEGHCCFPLLGGECLMRGDKAEGVPLA